MRRVRWLVVALMPAACVPVEPDATADASGVPDDVVVTETSSDTSPLSEAGGDAGLGEATAEASSEAGADVLTTDAVDEDGADVADAVGDAHDPCGEVGAAGLCVGNKVVRCDVPSGKGESTLVEEPCAEYEQCGVQTGSSGVATAKCLLLPGRCVPDTTECDSANPDVLRTCQPTATWTSETCSEGCEASPVGGFCRAASSAAGTAVRTVAFSGTVAYQYRRTDSATNPTNWGELATGNAAGALVVSYRGDEIVDAKETDENGQFNIQVPAAPNAGDTITVYPIRATEGLRSIAFAVAIPDVGDGEWSLSKKVPGAEGFYGWNFDLTKISTGTTLTIAESQMSGAMRVFDFLRYAYDVTSYLTGSSGKSLVIWMRSNTSWSCGACMSASPANVLEYRFDSQIFIPATARDQSYWSDAVTAHELGHWVMASFGRSPFEGGRHCLGVPTFPGQAWSEGFATLFSALVRENSLYFDKQEGSSFWIDIGRRAYSGDGNSWTRPAARDGLLQLIDENEVASMGWALKKAPSGPGMTLPDNRHFLDALASPQMRTAPFGRGYNRHVWRVSGCTKTSATDTGDPAPTFADYLDALICSGSVTAAEVDEVTSPSVNYPYPSRSPVCP